ncbi:S9 family peptidase [Myxococcus sp. RHSTA-1-4]|uniref:alpha/beta hydrolase family protein n=1 Tax=Myxococcus sp. RHSTA-1-4 TaxID=2874601 RepID=UPI001CBE3D2D|nr:alpha/beta fold hydrolase [Myxococcus sp. RHSTA-1-4]MBZ4415442.1 alpha/beta fold hydrolase [Myxococcus sp. RHSTA-1-4]
MSSMWVLETPAPPADARIPYGPLPHQFGDLRLPAGPGPHPVVVVIHGGFWRAKYDLEHVAHLCADLPRRGFATWSLEYRRVGHEGGGWPGTLEDVALGADFLRTLERSHALDLSRVVALGHSAGGHLAMWLGARHRLPPGGPLHSVDPLRLRGVVSLAGVVDLERGFELRLGDGIVETFLGGPPASVPERYRTASPAALQPLGLPQVLVHGTKDDTVPVSMSEAFCARGRELGDPIRCVTLPGAGHFEVIDPRSREWTHVVEAVRSCM